MRSSLLRKWLYLIGGSAMLLQAAPGGCPDSNQIAGVAATSVQSLITGVFGLYVRAGVNQAFGI